LRKPLSPVFGKKAHSFFKSDGAQAFVKRRVTPGGLFFMPPPNKNSEYEKIACKYFPNGINVDEPAYQAMVKNIVKRVYENFQVSFSDELPGFCSERAIAQNPLAALTLPGYPMSHYPLPINDNAVLRKRLNLSEGLSDTEKAIGRKVAGLLFAERVEAKIPMSKSASSGPPMFVRTLDERKPLIKHALSNLDKYLDLFVNYKFEQLNKEFNCLPAYVINWRFQADSCVDKNGKISSKERNVPYLRTAIDPHKYNDFFPASKSIVADGMFGQRARVVFTTSVVANGVLTAAISGYRDVYSHRYAYTYKHIDERDVTRKMRQYKYWIAVDVESYDSTIMDDFFEPLYDTLETKWDPRLVKMFKIMMKAPYYAKCFDLYNSNPERYDMWSGNPFDPDSYTAAQGLPSGISPNPDIGKFVNTFNTFIILQKYFGDAVEKADQVLKGEHPLYGFLNMGDDLMIGTNSADFYNKLHGALESEDVPTLEAMSANHLRLQVESPMKFIGLISYVNNAGEALVTRNAVSGLVNKLSFETEKKYWSIGHLANERVFAKAPIYDDLISIFCDEFSRSFNQDYRVVADHHADYMNRLLVEMAQTQADLLLLTDPSKIHYMVSESDLSEEFKKKMLKSIPVEEVEPFIGPLLQKPSMLNAKDILKETSSYDRMYTDNYYQEDLLSPCSSY
jgi:hypothetical protein